VLTDRKKYLKCKGNSIAVVHEGKKRASFSSNGQTKKTGIKHEADWVHMDFHTVNVE